MIKFDSNVKASLMFSAEDGWDSEDSINTQRIAKLAKSETDFPISCSNVGSNVTFLELELRKTNLDNPKVKRNWEYVGNKSRYPRIIQTRSLLRDELEMLKINMSINEKVTQFRESQIEKNYPKKHKKKKHKKLLKKCSPKSIKNLYMPNKIDELLTEIEESETAKTDTVVWKFLKRGSLRNELVGSRKYLVELQDWFSLGIFVPNTRPLKITCPNCTYFITTKIKKVSTIRTKLYSVVFAVIGSCISSAVVYSFKDTVHLCPLCKIYLGFCPAIGKQGPKRKSQPLNRSNIMSKDNNIMVSASSTSAKNLFVESKLRLSDRVQVNVNNIGAIAKQIQKGSKANENLIASAKNFASQEAAVENSETNLKKLRLLTVQLSNQVASLQNNASKLELVLEQVRSMQR